MADRDPSLISLGRRPRPTGRAVPLTPATRLEIDRVNERLRIEAFFSSHSRLTYLLPYLERITITESWCWEWPHRQANGYPTARSHIAGQPQVAIHRLVASAAHGEIPAGWFACHRCDVSNWRNGITRSQWLPPELTQGLVRNKRRSEATP